MSGRLNFLSFGDANGLSRSLTSPGIRARPLTTDGQTAAVPYPTVTVDRLETLQICGVVTPQITLNHPLVISDHMQDFVELLFGEILGAGIGVEPDLLDNQIGPLRSDAVDVTERERDFLFRGYFDAEETWHNRLGWLKIKLTREIEYLKGVGS